MGYHSSALDADHRIGATINNADQLSSITLIRLAVTGGTSAVYFHALLGSGQHHYQVLLQVE
ncbi:hypothetical protein [Methylobacterium iners]|uniref:Uncharacterized protein n=1 Tax=Methylobacterium iners TaxID=418707 RepID=A0ABQ4S3K0_9HYPH|nr:hypothetical protein [Methylobacterium iners]GJD97674.1 hypothetical protein OCOJLMKI_4907 [Methylobacterium iners]